MQLTTERLLLRTITVDDSNYILAQLNDPGWIKNIGNRNIHTLEAAKDYIQNKILVNVEKGIGTFFVIIRKDDPDQNIIGQCGVFRRDGLEYDDLGFAFLENYCGQGYGYESSKVVLDYALKSLGITKLCAITSEDNIASQKLLEKLGMQYLKTIPLPNIEGLSMYYEL